MPKTSFLQKSAEGSKRQVKRRIWQDERTGSAPNGVKWGDEWRAVGRANGKTDIFVIRYIDEELVSRG